MKFQPFSATLLASISAVGVAGSADMSMQEVSDIDGWDHFDTKQPSTLMENAATYGWDHFDTKQPSTLMENAATYAAKSGKASKAALLFPTAGKSSKVSGKSSKSEMPSPAPLLTSIFYDSGTLDYTNIGDVITLGCETTKLVADMDCSSMMQGPDNAAGATCIKMDCQANDCTLDCDGHKIIGPGREPDPLTVFVHGTKGIYVLPTANTVTIKNCVIEGFDQGIYVTDSSTVTLAADVGSITQGTSINVWTTCEGGDPGCTTSLTRPHYCKDFGLDSNNEIECCPGRDLPSPNSVLIDGETRIEKTVMTKNYNGMFATTAKISLVDSVAIGNSYTGITMQVCTHADFQNVLLCNNKYDIRYQGAAGNSKYIQQADGFVTFSTKLKNSLDTVPEDDIIVAGGEHRSCPASTVCPN